jgi:tRNA G18 (ribose-2'-O)-methylase SpoU
VLVTSDQAAAAVRAWARAVGNAGCEVVKLSAAGWKGVLRNVPHCQQQLEQLEECEKCEGRLAGRPELAESDDDGPAMAVAVHVRAERAAFARTLVLDRVKYKGNVGAIVRAAVQANLFSDIHYVGDPTRAAELATTDSKYHNGAGTVPAGEAMVSEKDVDYYSLMNAPLVKIHRHADPEAFLPVAAELHARQHTLVAVELTADSVDLFSPEADRALAQPGLCLVMGAEDKGTHPELLALCHHKIEIPSLSASINVVCAFMAVLTVLCASDRRAVAGR